MHFPISQIISISCFIGYRPSITILAGSSQFEKSNESFDDMLLVAAKFESKIQHASISDD